MPEQERQERAGIFVYIGFPCQPDAALHGAAQEPPSAIFAKTKTLSIERLCSFYLRQFVPICAKVRQNQCVVASSSAQVSHQLCCSVRAIFALLGEMVRLSLGGVGTLACRASCPVVLEFWFAWLKAGSAFFCEDHKMNI